MEIGAATMENNMAIPQKIKNGTTIWSSNSPPGYFSEKKLRTLTWKDICTPMYIAALFTRAKVWKQANCPWMDVWIQVDTHTHTHTCTHTHTGIFFTHEEEGNPTSWDHMDGPWGHYANWNKSDRERKIPMISLTSRIENKQTTKTQQ